MEGMSKKQGFVVDIDSLPPLFPTHLHSPEFWEQLGRTVATFGRLEEVLGRAIFALTATVPYDEAEMEGAYERWLPTLERALTDPLGGLIESYGKSYRSHPDAAFDNFDGLLDELRRASAMRNVLCHGSWRKPDAQGRSLPLFVNRRKEVFCTPVDIEFLRQTQRGDGLAVSRHEGTGSRDLSAEFLDSFDCAPPVAVAPCEITLGQPR